MFGTQATVGVMVAGTVRTSTGVTVKLLVSTGVAEGVEVSEMDVRALAGVLESVGVDVRAGMDLGP